VSAPAIELRPAVGEDVKAVESIERACFSDPWSLDSFRDLVGRDEAIFTVAVAGRDEEVTILGFAVLYLAGPDADLANLAVEGEARRHGVGRRLLRDMVVRARERGVFTIFLEVRASNEAARALYGSEGFVEVGRRARYYVRPVEDALILRRELR